MEPAQIIILSELRKLERVLDQAKNIPEKLIEILFIRKPRLRNTKGNRKLTIRSTGS